MLFHLPQTRLPHPLATLTVLQPVQLSHRFRFQKTRCQVGEYMRGLPTCMLIFCLSVGSQTTKRHRHYMEVGRWVRRCVDPVRDLSQSYWTGQKVTTYQTALREGRCVSNGIEDQVVKLYVLILLYPMTYLFNCLQVHARAER